MTTSAESRQADRPKGTLGRWALFVAIGLMLYLGLYAWSERLVRENGGANRLYQIATALQSHYDTVILGASHAMPLGYDGMTETLEAESGTSIMNLSIEGGGIVPARFLLDYFLSGHSADQVIVFLDSFAFYSRQWNEDRLKDADLFRRAPLDPTLVAAMLRHAPARGLLPAYLSGFHKINDEERLVVDVPDGEAKFDRVYRPIPQVDRQRIAYLFPPEIDRELFRRYLDELAALVDEAEAAGAAVVLVKPPTPERYRENLPEEAAFDAAIAQMAEERGLMLHDLSRTVLGDEFYYDTDHLNREGVDRFVEQDFLEILQGG
jgi:hypothetical protein